MMTTPEMQFNPRNPWHHIEHILALGRHGRAGEGRHLLEGLRYHSDLSLEDYARIDRLLLAQQREPLPVRGPSDFLENPEGLWRVSFRELKTNQTAPKPYPVTLALPKLQALRNDIGPLYQAAAAMAGTHSDLAYRFLIVYDFDQISHFGSFLQDLQNQDYSGSIDVIVCARHDSDSAWEALEQSGIPGEVLAAPLLSAEAQSRILSKVTKTDLIGVFSGAIRIDVGALSRSAHLAPLGDQVFQPLAALGEAGDLPNALPYASNSLPNLFGRRYPFRDIKTCNFIVTKERWRNLGGLDQRFHDPVSAARHLAFLCFNLGAYFMPLWVPDVAMDATAINAQDKALLRELCPNAWDRPDDGTYLVPKVSVYIPTYNASKYIEEAVDSVLAQDVADLEVCLANDGSTDHTLELLERSFGDDPRVRIHNHRNGGIGYASNQAITMARGIYIGQLDSDDRLKPGAVRRMMEYLDENPDVACCYGSCERVDAKGNYLQQEYSWRHFSRQKMMITSIAHHFRMFRRANWARTSLFRHDIRNAVDYDIFLKLAETGHFHHIDETLYQRRWHGENTSNVNEGFQTANTYRVQREALRRQGLDRYWDVHVADPAEPRRVGYRRSARTPRVMFWPNYSRSNPYQSLLYRSAMDSHEIVAAPIEEAVRALELAPEEEAAIFHLHWTNFLFVGVDDRGSARLAVRAFLKSLTRFKALGGKIIWTIHNTLSHDNPYADLERSLSERIVKLADVIHFHSAESFPEVRAVFDIPSHKIRISRHGHYLGVYGDYVSRETARLCLGLDAEDEVILFLGQVRPYKGVGQLVKSFREILKTNPRARLLIGGAIHDEFWATVYPELTALERSRILASERFLDETELQVYLRAADLAVFPYRNILTSGSLLLALSFGLPVVIPEVGMTREVLKDSEAGILYERTDPGGLFKALVAMLDALKQGRGDAMRAAAYRLAQAQDWPNVAETLFGDAAASKDLNLNKKEAVE